MSHADPITVTKSSDPDENTPLLKDSPATYKTSPAKTEATTAASVGTQTQDDGHAVTTSVSATTDPSPNDEEISIQQALAEAPVPTVSATTDPSYDEEEIPIKQALAEAQAPTVSATTDPTDPSYDEEEIPIKQALAEAQIPTVSASTDPSHYEQKIPIEQALAEAPVPTPEETSPGGPAKDDEPSIPVGTETSDVFIALDEFDISQEQNVTTPPGHMSAARAPLEESQKLAIAQLEEVRRLRDIVGNAISGKLDEMESMEVDVTNMRKDVEKLAHDPQADQAFASRLSSALEELQRRFEEVKGDNMQILERAETFLEQVKVTEGFDAKLREIAEELKNLNTSANTHSTEVLFALGNEKDNDDGEDKAEDAIRKDSAVNE